MARLRNMVTNGRRTAFYLLACFINSQRLSAVNNKITGCFLIVRGMAAWTPITVNNRGPLDCLKSAKLGQSFVCRLFLA